MLATLIIHGRYWYDFMAVASIVTFLLEMVLLYRNSLIGWAMTAKCLVLAGVFGWALLNPPPITHESVTIEKVVTYTVLIITLGVVIAILAAMRILRMTVIVGPTQENHHA